MNADSTSLPLHAESAGTRLHHCNSCSDERCCPCPACTFKDASDERIAIALEALTGFGCMNGNISPQFDGLHLEAARRLRRREQPNSALPLFGLAPFMADIIRDELRECASDEWTPESLAEAIVSALREKAPEQADSRITRDQFSRIVGEMSTYDFVNGTLDVEAVFNGAGVEIV